MPGAWGVLASWPIHGNWSIAKATLMDPEGISDKRLVQVFTKMKLKFLEYPKANREHFIKMHGRDEDGDAQEAATSGETPSSSSAVPAPPLQDGAVGGGARRHPRGGRGEGANHEGNGAGLQ